VKALLRRLLLVFLAGLFATCQAATVHEVHSPYSHIQVIDKGSKRAMIFVGDSGVQAVESLIDLDDPNRLQHPYARTMMSGLIYCPDAKAGLMIGLGGGALVRFLNYHFPQMSLDVVEIDPVVVSVSREYFYLEPGPQTRIFVEDGLTYLGRVSDRYDLIFMNAHLHPGKDTDSGGMPLQFQETTFLKSLHQRLRLGGIVMFNVIGNRDSAYIANIRSAFPFVEVLRPAGSGNLIVVGAAVKPSDGELRERAQALDRRGVFRFSFERLLDERRR